ncbi:YciI family protein (plasmid) [Sphingomonas paeninsulae]|uniref:YciI family protein n=1 Tax=Sphingomonas paeninsulae TaxID=2319844 RepID=A0A494TI90_SPHPE|nr:YciI family protein [Sphingomonas paeninsulae]AYJ85148.1 YciI family protein [Sphingomonas paeninsulae]
MPYMIATYDKPEHEHVRDATRARHLEFLEANVDKMIAGGGFWNNEKTAVIGGLMLLDVDTKAEAEAFIAQDPFTHANLFARVEIVRWSMSFLDFKRIYPAAK